MLDFCKIFDFFVRQKNLTVLDFYGKSVRLIPNYGQNIDIILGHQKIHYPNMGKDLVLLTITVLIIFIKNFRTYSMDPQEYKLSHFLNLILSK